MILLIFLMDFLPLLVVEPLLDRALKMLEQLQILQIQHKLLQKTQKQLKTEK